MTDATNLNCEEIESDLDDWEANGKNLADSVSEWPIEDGMCQKMDPADL